MIIQKLKKFIKKKIAFLYRYGTLKILFPVYYNFYKRKGIEENKVIFLETSFSQLSNSFVYLHSELKKYNYKIECYFLEKQLIKKIEYTKRVLWFLKSLATAKYLFINEASDVASCIKMRKETKLIQTWHGCGAFKKFGMSTAELIFGGTREDKLRFPNYKNIDIVTVSSSEVIWAYAEAMELENEKEKIKPIGVSRTDVYFDEKFKNDSYNKLYQLIPQAEGKKIILYAPTFRGRVANAKTSNRLNIEMFYENFSEEYVLLIKHHPLVKKRPKILEYCQNFAFDCTEILSIEELLCVTDICISDYSSLIFEFSLFEKPMIFFAYDLEEYFDWRGFYYSYEELTPGPVFTNNLEIVKYIKEIDKNFDKNKVIEFKNKFMSACDGNSTKRILDLVFEDTIKNKGRNKQW